LEIAELPVRFGIAIDSRDLDALVELYVPDIRVTREMSGREALRETMGGRFKTFGRSIHQIGGHVVEFDPDDPDHATGRAYCRAEHEVDDRWMVMAIMYFDDYRRLDGRWLFASRRIRNWYAVDVNEHPQAVNFDSWNHGNDPSLPGYFPTWEKFWSES
jgi:hypothetical protein